MRKLKKGAAPSPVNYSLAGKFTYENRDWYVYLREIDPERPYCNLKVIHPGKITKGSANLWLGYKMGMGDDTKLLNNASSLNIEQHHKGLDKAILDFCREKMPETFS